MGVDSRPLYMGSEFHVTCLFICFEEKCLAKDVARIKRATGSAVVVVVLEETWLRSSDWGCTVEEVRTRSSWTRL